MKHIRPFLAIFSFAVVLLIGVPLFVRKPVWVDVTYHDISAWNILHGGVHYRDVFETNLPGMVWLHALIRPVIGWSFEAIRIVDLLVFASVLLLLLRFQKRGDECPRPKRVAAIFWFLTAAALFYLFESEFIHCQRDGWMLLPALAATRLRLVRCTRPLRPGWSALEGLAWGLAVWIKPHVLVPALLVWLTSLRFQTRRAALFETLWLVTGGTVAGALGSIWLIRTHAWSPMWDVLLNWNGEYYAWSWRELLRKVNIVSTYFAPFSLLHFVAVPVGIWAIIRKDPPRALLAALYLGWLAQATLIQKEFDYAHYPPTLLGLALLASFRLPVGPVFLSWCLLAGALNEYASESAWLNDTRRAHPNTTRVLRQTLDRLRGKYHVTIGVVLPHHPIVRSDRLALWPRCWRDDSWELKDELTDYHDIHSAPDWADLHRVADFLRTKNLHDRDLICWFDSTHPLYLWLQIKPGIRYPHVITAMKFKSKREQIRREAFESPARYVVSDLVPVSYLNSFGPAPAPGPTNSLPPEFPSWGENVYPWNQPVIFRAGRYFVHEVKNPHGSIMFPMPKGLLEQ